MAKTVTITYRENLPGQGFNDAGAPRGRVRVSGKISISSYTAAGEPLVAKDLGLKNLDQVSFIPVSVVVGAAAKYADATNMPVFQYTYTSTGASGLLQAFNTVRASGVQTVCDTSAAAVCYFTAVGEPAEQVRSLP